MYVYIRVSEMDDRCEKYVPRLCLSVGLCVCECGCVVEYLICCVHTCTHTRTRTRQEFENVFLLG